jgi:hypothetical protein
VTCAHPMNLIKLGFSIKVNDKVIDYLMSNGLVYLPRIDQEVYAKLAEMDMVVADLERANTRVATVERRNVSGHPLQ